jgi:protein-L-isoaspartate O-methyltransferase
VVADPSELRARLVAELGDLTGPWREAFAEVPRHEFIPPLVWRQRRSVDGNDMYPLRRDDQPDEWLALAYANRPVDTQVDDGHPAADGTGHEPTSSASQPAVVADMLVALDAEPGMRVLEVGTGTGYNAALLAYRLGAETVVSVEIDPRIADQARAALARTGFGTVTVITGDGAQGYAEAAPYDRILATAGVVTVPYAWVAQTGPGGRIVAPLTGTYQPPGILTLDVHGDGTASGRLGGPAAFMALRAQRVARPRGRPIDLSTGQVSATEVHPYFVAGDRAAATAIGLRVPRVHKLWSPGADERTGTLWLLDPDSDSWAAVALTPDPPYETRQGGGRKLWDEVEAAYRWWVGADEPPVDAWLITVTPNGQWVELQPAGALT